MTEEPHNDRPGLWRLTGAARLAGMTPESFESASLAGRIPVRVERVGPRLAYVRVAELEQWPPAPQIPPQAPAALCRDHAVMAASRLLQFERLAEAVGPGGALSLLAFYDGVPTVYVPSTYRPRHLLERVLGEAGFLRMIAHFGGETVSLPSGRMEAARHAGAVYRGMRRGLPTAAIAVEAGISWRRVRQLETTIKAGKPLTAAARRN